MRSKKPPTPTVKPNPLADATLVEIRRRGAAGRSLSSGANRGDWLYAAAVRSFGSWGAAVEKAGFAYSNEKRAALSAHDVVDRIRRLAAEGGRLRTSEHPILASGARRHFGGWKPAFAAAGCSPRETFTWTTVAVVAAIREDLTNGLPVNSVAMAQRNGKLYVAGRRRFGSWAAALIAAKKVAPASSCRRSPGASR